MTLRLLKVTSPVALLVVVESVPPKVAPAGVVSATVTVGNAAPEPHAFKVIAGEIAAFNSVLVGCWMYIKAVLPVSFKVPKLGLDRLGAEVPLKVISPVASGEQKVGITWMPDHVSEPSVLPALEAATLMVMVEAVTVALELLKVRFLAADPLIKPTETVTGAAVLNLNPAGAVNTMVPTPIPLGAVSDSVGPLSVTQIRLAILLLSMALPPVAGVTFTTAGTAKAGEARLTAISAGISTRKLCIAFIIFFSPQSFANPKRPEILNLMAFITRPFNSMPRLGFIIFLTCLSISYGAIVTLICLST